MIHIGDKWGHRYDLTIDFLKRSKYFIKTGILLPYHSEMLDRIYEQFPEFFPTKEDVVYDIGSQYGDYSLICIKKYNARKVYAWEPLYDNFIKMENLFWKHNVSYGLFGHDAGDINFYNYALSDKKEEKTMNYKNNMLSIINTDNHINTNNHSAIIRYEVLDDVLKSKPNMFLPTLMKIDVEGYEMNVLNGALRTISASRPKIIIETHTTQLENEVRAFLKNLNYNEPKEYRRIKNKDGNEFVNLFFMPMEE